MAEQRVCDFGVAALYVFCVFWPSGALLLLGLLSLIDRRFDGGDIVILTSAVVATGAYARFFLFLVIACIAKATSNCSFYFFRMDEVP